MINALRIVRLPAAPANDTRDPFLARRILALVASAPSDRAAVCAAAVLTLLAKGDWRMDPGWFAPFLESGPFDRVNALLAQLRGTYP